MHQVHAVSTAAAVVERAASAGPPDRGTEVSTSTGAADEADPLKQRDFDPRQYRTFEVAVSITMHDIQAHLVKVSKGKGNLQQAWCGLDGSMLDSSL